jgi:cytochrome oxidase assembly protein ShyY1
METFSIWHGIIVLVIICVPAAVVGLVIWLVVRATRKPAVVSVSTAPPVIPASPMPVAQSAGQQEAAAPQRSPE